MTCKKLIIVHELLLLVIKKNSFVMICHNKIIIINQRKLDVEVISFCMCMRVSAQFLDIHY